MTLMGLLSRWVKLLYIQLHIQNFKEDQFKEKIKFKELTFCFRIHIENFRLLNTYGAILHGLDGAGWASGKEVER